MKFQLLIFILLGFLPVLAQEDLDDLLEAEMSVQTDYTIATFKATRIVNGHSIERMQEGELDFRISHRFDRLNTGISEFFGFDRASTMMSLEYGATDWMMFGIGHATLQKYYNGFLKLSLLRQSTGNTVMPLSLSAYASAAGTAADFNESDPRADFDSRFEYAFQLLIARKFSEAFSIQFSPTIVHRNLVTETNDNDLFSLGLGARYKLSNRVSVNIEYFHVFNKDDQIDTDYYDPLSIGFDIETGGHVFQIYMTNSISIVDGGYIGRTTGNWLDGDIHVGFNISRVFTLY